MIVDVDACGAANADPVRHSEAAVSAAASRAENLFMAGAMVTGTYYGCKRRFEGVPAEKSK